MADRVTSLQTAQAVSQKLKEQFDFGKKKQPEWFSNTSIGLEQDGSYRVDICIPSHNSIDDETRATVPYTIDGICVGFRVVTEVINIFEKKSKPIEKQPIFTIEWKRHAPDIESDPYFVTGITAGHHKTFEEAKKFCESGTKFRPHEASRWWWFTIYENKIDGKTPLRLLAVYDWNGKELKEEPIKGYKKLSLKEIGKEELENTKTEWQSAREQMLKKIKEDK